MLRHLGSALRITVLSIAIFGFAYPLAMTGLSAVVFPAQAAGSLLSVDGRVVGSDIIGQAWTKPGYFHGRPSAAGKNGYDPTATGGTNLAATSKKLIQTTAATVATLKKENRGATQPIPIDLVTSSGSGIDPDISPEAAYYQAPRIAGARHVSVARITALIGQHVKPRTWGFLGDPRVNVLALNIALDHLR